MDTPRQVVTQSADFPLIIASTNRLLHGPGPEASANTPTLSVRFGLNRKVIADTSVGLTPGKVEPDHIYKRNQDPESNANSTDEIMVSEFTAITPGDAKIRENGNLESRIKAEPLDLEGPSLHQLVSVLDRVDELVLST